MSELSFSFHISCINLVYTSVGGWLKENIAY